MQPRMEKLLADGIAEVPAEIEEMILSFAFKFFDFSKDDHCPVDSTHVLSVPSRSIQKNAFLAGLAIRKLPRERAKFDHFVGLESKQKSEIGVSKTAEANLSRRL